MDDTHSEIVASKADHVAQRDQLAALFEAHPHTVIRHEVIEGLVGRNYQQRISDARRDLRMNIENVKRYGADGKRLSGDYRFRPAALGRDAADLVHAQPVNLFTGQLSGWQDGR